MTGTEAAKLAALEVTVANAVKSFEVAMSREIETSTEIHAALKDNLSRITDNLSRLTDIVAGHTTDIAILKERALQEQRDRDAARGDRRTMIGVGVTLGLWFLGGLLGLLAQLGILTSPRP